MIYDLILGMAEDITSILHPGTPWVLGDSPRAYKLCTPKGGALHKAQDGVGGEEGPCGPLNELVHHAIVGDEAEALPVWLLEDQPAAVEFTFLCGFLYDIITQHTPYHSHHLQIKMNWCFEDSAVFDSLPFLIYYRHPVFDYRGGHVHTAPLQRTASTLETQIFCNLSFRSLYCFSFCVISHFIC